MTLRQFLLFTAISLPACALLILFIDQPLTVFVHRHFQWAYHFLDELTGGADRVLMLSMETHVAHLPVLFVGLGVAFVIGRYLLKRRAATVFLVVLLTHLASVITSNVLKGVVHRLRPNVLFGPGYEGTGLWASGPHNDSFPSSHTATYFSLFLPLAVTFPRWRVPLLALPTLIGAGRLVLGAHYLSDVWFSIWLVAGYTFLFGLLQRPAGGAGTR